MDRDKIVDLKKKDLKKYSQLRKRFGSNGWFEISSPCFSKKGEYALIKIHFGRTMSFNKFNYYLLRKKHNGYIIIKTIDL